MAGSSGIAGSYQGRRSTDDERQVKRALGVMSKKEGQEYAD